MAFIRNSHGCERQQLKFKCLCAAAYAESNEWIVWECVHVQVIENQTDKHDRKVHSGKVKINTLVWERKKYSLLNKEPHFDPSADDFGSLLAKNTRIQVNRSLHIHLFNRKLVVFFPSSSVRFQHFNSIRLGLIAIRTRECSEQSFRLVKFYEWWVLSAVYYCKMWSIEIGEGAVANRWKSQFGYTSLNRSMQILKLSRCSLIQSFFRILEHGFCEHKTVCIQH